MNLMMIPLLLIVAIVPIIARAVLIHVPIDSIHYLAYPLADTFIDFLTYAKSRGIIYFTSAGVILYLLQGRRDRLNSDKKYIYLAIGLLISTGLCLLMSPFLELALKGVADRYEGGYVWISYVVMMFLISQIVDTKKKRLQLLGGICFSLIIIHIVGVLQLFKLDLFRSSLGSFLVIPNHLHNVITHLSIPFGLGTVYSFFNNPNYGGSIASLTLPIILVSFAMVKSKKYQIISYLGYILGVLELQGTHSRGGLVGCTIVFIVWSVIFRKQFKKIILLLITFILVTIGMHFTKGNDHLVQLNSGGKTYVREINLVKPRSLDILFDNKKVNLTFIGKENNISLKVNNKEQELKTITTNNQKRIYIKNSDKFMGDFYLEQEKQYIYTVNYLGFKYPIIVGDNILKTYGMKNKIEDIYSADRFKLFDGLEKKGSKRGYIWSRSIPLIKKTGLFGTGPDTFSVIFPQNDNFGKRLGFNQTNILVDKPHNFYLQMIINMGLVYFVLFVILIVNYYFDFLRKINIFKIENYINNKDNNNNKNIDKTNLGILLICMLSVGGYLATGMFNDSTVMTSPYLWSFLGLGISTLYTLKNNNKSINQKSEEKEVNIDE